MACLYMITSPSGKSYIGYSARSADERFKEHVSNATAKRTTSVVHGAIRKYGAENMRVSTIVIGWPDYCFELEDAAIKAYGTMLPNGYNMVGGGIGLRGMHESVIARRAATLKKTMATPEQKEMRSKLMVDRWAIPENKERHSQIMRKANEDPKVKAASIAHLARLRADKDVESRRRANMAINCHTPEAQAKRSASTAASKGTPEARMAAREASKAMWSDDDHIKKVRDAFAKRFAEGKTSRGYIYPTKNGKFSVRIRLDGENVVVGTFENHELAGLARDAFLKEKGRL